MHSHSNKHAETLVAVATSALRTHEIFCNTSQLSCGWSLRKHGHLLKWTKKTTWDCTRPRDVRTAAAAAATGRPEGNPTQVLVYNTQLFSFSFDLVDLGARPRALLGFGIIEMNLCLLSGILSLLLVAASASTIKIPVTRNATNHENEIASLTNDNYFYVRSLCSLPPLWSATTPPSASSWA